MEIILDKYCWNCKEWVHESVYVEEDAICGLCQIARDVTPAQKQTSQYYNRVKYLTELNAPKVPNINMRGEEYQLDHKISIAYGLENSIPAEHIAHIDNLQVIPTHTNQSKGRDNHIDKLNNWIIK